MLKNKLEPRNSTKKIEQRSSVQELRASEDGEGIIEGHITAWGTVDSYGSRFQRGCFKKTIENRLSKIKVLYDHGKLAGSLLEIKENDYGCFIRAQMNMKVEAGRDAFYLAQAGDLDCLSFGFRTIKDKYEDGIQVITEVMLGEVSPVVFEANAEAKITSVRSTNFNDTDDARELRERGWRLFLSLDVTLDDIWWDSESEDQIMISLQKAIGDFSAAYLSWAQEVVDIRSGGIRIDLNSGNLLTESVRNYCEENKTDLEQIAKTSNFTIDELRTLKSGKTIADYDRLSTLSAAISKAHTEVRNKAVATLCDELRAGLNPAEATRIQALLNKSLLGEADVDVLDFMGEFRKKLNGEG